MSKKNKNNFEPETKVDEIIKEQEIKEDEIIEDSTDDVEELKVDADSEIEVIEEESSKSSVIGTVNTEKLNVRSMPSLTSEVLKVLNMNDTVVIIDDEDPLFYLIEFDETKHGYVMKEFINK